MKKVLLVVCGLFLLLKTAGWADSKTNYHVTYSNISSEEINLTITLDPVTINSVARDNVRYSVIELDGGAQTKQKGYAELPFISTTVSVPLGSDIQVELTNADYKDITIDYPLLPSRGTLFRSQNPASIPFEIDPESIVDDWYPEVVMTGSEPFRFRDARGIRLITYPVLYNAETKTLRMYTSIDISVRFNNNGQRKSLQKSNGKGPVLKEMEEIYRSLFINYETSSIRAKASATGNSRDTGDMLVIHTPRDAGVIAKFVQWKREKGFTVQTQEVAKGTRVTDVIKKAYETNSNLLYVQLVGDWADIKSEEFKPGQYDQDNKGGEPMDPKLGCVKGNDNFPDLVIGRFSAQTTDELTTQIDKAIAYEKTPDVTGTWYSNGLGIASDEGKGEGDDGEGDWEHIDIIKKNKLLPFTYTGVNEIYKTGSASDVTTYLNNGLGLINYAGHGDENSWVTTNFSRSHINALENKNKLPILISVACINGAFQMKEACFAEVWLKKKDGGAVAALMSSIYQPWLPPMKGQDYFNDLLTGGYDYSKNPGSGTSTTKGKTTFGLAVMNAVVMMIAESAQSDDLDTLNTWTIFGDVSLQMRTKKPIAVDLPRQTISKGQAFSVTLKNLNGPVANAVVVISQNDKMYKGITDSSGRVTINHGLTGGNATVVASGFNLATQYYYATLGKNPDLNMPPKADASFDRLVKHGERVTLDGSGSNELDINDSIASYKWEQVSGPTVKLTDANSVKATFDVTKDTTAKGIEYIFKLTVTDQKNLTDSDSVSYKTPGKKTDPDNNGNNNNGGNNNGSNNNGSNLPPSSNSGSGSGGCFIISVFP